MLREGGDVMLEKTGKGIARDEIQLMDVGNLTIINAPIENKNVFDENQWIRTCQKNIPLADKLMEDEFEKRHEKFFVENISQKIVEACPYKTKHWKRRTSISIASIKISIDTSLFSVLLFISFTSLYILSVVSINFPSL